MHIAAFASHSLSPGEITHPNRLRSLRDNPASFAQSYDCTESTTCPHGARRSMWSKSWDVLRLTHGGPRRPASGYNDIHLCLFRTAMLSPGSSVVPCFRHQVAPIVGWIEGQSIPDGSRWRPMHNPIKLGLKEPKISVRSSARPPFSLPAGWIERPFAALRGKHLGKIGGQDQWPFLRIFKRKPLTILGPVKWHRFPKKNRLEIKEIPFFGLKWASENK